MKKYFEEHGDLAAAFGVLAALVIAASAIVGYEHGIIIGIEAFVTYIAVYSAVFIICVLILSYSLVRIGLFSSWRIAVVILVILFDAALYVTAVVFVRLRVFPQTDVASAQAIDPGFWLLNVMGAIVIITAATWSVEIVEEKSLKKSGATS